MTQSYIRQNCKLPAMPAMGLGRPPLLPQVASLQRTLSSTKTN